VTGDRPGSDANHLPLGYTLRQGSGLDRALLVKFMQRTYQELAPGNSFEHLAQTVEQYFSSDTPVWWVYCQSHKESETSVSVASEQVASIPQPIGCLWLGSAVDQVRGDRHAHIFLLYVALNYRRQGLGAALVDQAEAWAIRRGDRQVGLHVFQSNQPAISFYSKMGYEPQSLWMVKPLK